MGRFLDETQEYAPKGKFLDEGKPYTKYTPSPIFSLTAQPTEQDVITPTDIITGMTPWKAMGGIIKERVTKPAVLNLANRLPNVGRDLLPRATSISDIGMKAGLSVPPRTTLTEAADIIADPRTYLPSALPKRSQALLTGVEGKIKELIPKRVSPELGQKGLSIFKQGRDYLYEKVAKPVSNIIFENFKKSPEIAKKVGLKDETINLVKKYGYDTVKDVAGADEIASRAFNEAMSKKTKVFGDKINISNTLKMLENKFNSIKKTDPNNPLGKLVQNIRKFRPAPKGFFEGMPGGISEKEAVLKGKKLLTKTQVKRVVSGEKVEDIAKEVRISRKQFVNIRQQIDNLYKAKVMNKGDVLDIVGSLYDDGEKAGLTGIQKARELYHQARQFEDVATNLTKIDKLNPTTIHSKLQTVANDPTKYQQLVDEYTPYLGKETAQKLFKEALSVRRGKKIIRRSVVGGLTASGLYGAGRGIQGIIK